MKFDVLTLARTQARASQAASQSPNLRAVFRLPGVPDKARLARAVASVADRCKPLRWHVIHGEDGPRYLLHDAALAQLDVIDIIDADEAHYADEASLSCAITSLCERPLRLDAGAPWAITLLCSDGASYLVFACHAGLLDRFSLTPLFAALSQAYAGTGESPCDELGLDQQAVLDAERASLEPEQWRGDLAFWVRELGDGAFAWQPPRLEGESADARFSVPLGAALSRELRIRAEELGLSTEFLLQACLHVLLQTLARQPVVITAHHQRGRRDTLGQIGFDERVHFIRSNFDDAMTLRQFFLHAASKFAMADFHANIPAGDVLEELKRLNPGYDRATTVLCERDELPHDALVLGDLRGVLVTHFSERADGRDTSIYLRMADEIVLDVSVRHPQSARGLAIALEHYVALLGRIGEQLDTPIGQLDFDTDALSARRRAWSTGGPLVIEPHDVLASFDERVRHHPDAPAVGGDDEHFSYAGLARAAARIAEGIAPHVAQSQLVGVCLSRGARVVPAMLGVLSARAGYVPLDPLMPEERLRFMAADAQLSAVIADADTLARVQTTFACAIVLIEDLLAQSSTDLPTLCRAADPALAAYVIYTSGTTGEPKGVVIERGMLANTIASLEGRYERGMDTRWLQFASVNFDASVLEIFNPLTRGGHLIVAPETVRADPAALFEFLRESRVTHAFLPPAVLRLLPRRPLPDLRTILCGGEASDDDTVRFWSSVVRLSNIYGPTEITIMCAENTFHDQKLANQIGRPLPGYAIHLLDANGRAVPLGGIGEICIGGASVARGYLRRPELTAQKFFDDPQGAGRLYRSGDLARFLPTGDIEFLGRSDFQVKVRGYRVEIGEVEQVIAAQPEVSAVCIGTRAQQGSTALVAWYSASALGPAALRRRLETRLPSYMIPAILVPVDTWPLTLNGKIDRARLPEPLATASHAEARDFDALERTVQACWAKTLGMPKELIDEHTHFFDAGGHSLLATLACARIGAALGCGAKPGMLLAHPSFDAFCRVLRDSMQQDDALPPIECGEHDAAGVAVTSAIAQAIGHRVRFNREDNAYNIVVRADFSREVNPLDLHAALTRVFARDPLFKSRLVDVDGEMHLVLLNAEAACIPACIPIETATQDAIRAQAEAWIQTPISPEDVPCWRAEMLLDTESRASTLLFCIHHAMFDGWSLKLLMDEIAAEYEGRAAESRTLNWFDYCAWKRRIEPSPQYARALDYWKRKLANVPLRLDLPFDSTTRKPDSNRVLRVSLTLDQTARLRAIAQAQGTTLSPVLFALHLLWLWRVSGNDAPVTGYPQAGRDQPGSETIYGMLVSMAVLTTRIDPRQRFGELVAAVHRQMLEDRDHMLATAYEAGVADIGTLNTLFSLQSGIDLSGRIGAGRFTVEDMPSKTSKADIAAIFYASQNGAIDGRIEYDGSLIAEHSARSMRDVLTTLIDSASRMPDTLVGELPYLNDAQRALVTRFSRGTPISDAPASIPARFAEIAARFGSTDAVRFEGRTLSYATLDALSSRIASGLTQWVSADACVGLAMSKGPMLVAAILGVLKAGCAYVPLDPSYPAERLRHFAENCALTAGIADARGRAGLTAAGLTHLQFVDADELAQAAPRALHEVSPDALAYVIHTSGSTGKPKGVLIEHHSVVRMIAGAAGPLNYEPGCVNLLLASINFDASVLEIFLALLNGGTLVIAPEDARRDSETLHRLLESARVTHAILTPVLLQGLPKVVSPDLRVLAFGGDALDETTARWWSRHTRLLSLYGPTEATVMATSGQIEPDGPVRVLGKPLPGYDVYLLDTDGRVTPPGSVGELCIGGENLARGYRNEATLTLRRFIDDPFAGKPYARMYRTGDLGRYLADGTIEYLGRNDAQVKLRGYRIELGEIENQLAGMPGVQLAACAIRGEGEQRYIAAYYVRQHGAPVNEAAMREHIAATLPDYMAPARYVELDALPLSGSGKIDRNALPVPPVTSAGEAPREGLETAIARVWCALLHVDCVSREDHFFHLGGNSILAMRMHAQVRAETGFDFPMAAFYRAPTIAALMAGVARDDIACAVADASAALPRMDVVPAWRGDGANPVRKIVLTGASGFIGIHLLYELCRRVETVFCLQRCDDPASGRARLLGEARAAGLTIDFSRVQVICADLARPALGLADADWQRLAQEADAILHCGAHVHHLHGYASLKDANVGSTEALLRLALSVRRKPLCFVSTLSVPMMLDGVSRVEERIGNERPLSDNGYLLGKWVSEQRVAAYSRAFDLPVTVMRVGNVTGNSRTGYSNYAHNHFWLFNQGCLQMEAYPLTGQAIEMTPVDVLASAMCALALHPRDGLQVANLQNPVSIGQREWFESLAALGLHAQPEAPAQWKQRLTTIDSSNGLALLRDFYTGDLTSHDMPVDQIGTISRLAQFDVGIAESYGALIETYVRYLREEGFFPAAMGNVGDMGDMAVALS
ncbi:non-ribosomal peptide synthetase [Caballeronia sp. BR00000012568055]|uniref:non-ribosomal peptide synthetase n=1 Tax=Caballeronia sp. BR00000012568055 TaxID=2918761 RepID=UPI0023F67CC5|nr:non-ribosomal peptide synthetase [Caballeronia sp. BR00000012568055]